MMISGHLLGAFAGCAAAAVGQLFLKAAARGPVSAAWGIYLRPMMWMGYAWILTSTVVNTWAYRVVPARAIAAFLPLTLLLVVLLSAGLLRERMTRRQWVGVGLILSGVSVFALA